MRDCSAAIFIASVDDDALEADGKPIKRARQNVIYELGAASSVYGQRIVNFKENGVEFPRNSHIKCHAQQREDADCRN